MLQILAVTSGLLLVVCVYLIGSTFWGGNKSTDLQD